MSHNRRWWFGAFASLPIAVLSSCASQQPPSLTSSASHQLSTDVDRVASAAHAGNLAAVRTAIATLKTDVARLQDSGGITAARAAEVLSAAARIAADSGADAPVVVATHTPSPTPAVVTTKPTKKKKGDGGDGHSE